MHTYLRAYKHRVTCRQIVQETQSESDTKRGRERGRVKRRESEGYRDRARERESARERVRDIIQQESGGDTHKDTWRCSLSCFSDMGLLPRPPMMNDCTVHMHARACVPLKLECVYTYVCMFYFVCIYPQEIQSFNFLLPFILMPPQVKWGVCKCGWSRNASILPKGQRLRQYLLRGRPVFVYGQLNAARIPLNKYVSSLEPLLFEQWSPSEEMKKKKVCLPPCGTWCLSIRLHCGFTVNVISSWHFYSLAFAFFYSATIRSPGHRTVIISESELLKSELLNTRQNIGRHWLANVVMRDVR